MTRILALAVVVAALLGAAPASAKLGDLYAFRYGAHGNILIPYDSARLVQSGPAIQTGHFGHAWSLSPDRSLLVSAPAWRKTKGQESTLAFVDLHVGRIVGTMSLPDEFRPVTSTAWVHGRVLGIISGASTTVYAIDPVKRSVVSKVELDGRVVVGERTRNGVVLLLETPDEIGPATLAVVDQAPRVRTVRLDRITVGLTGSGHGDDRTITTHRPGLAVSPSDRQVYVFGGRGEPAAAIDLRTLAVRYSPLRLLAAATKGRATGSVRTAAALPDGRIVLSGHDFGAGGSKPFVRIVDPKDWSSKLISRESPWFRVGGGWLFTHGDRGSGLRIWKPSGRVVDAFQGRAVAGVHVVGPRAFVLFFGAKAAVLELGTGRVVRQSVPAHPLLGDGEAIPAIQTA